jgi:hypothetical protein
LNDFSRPEVTGRRAGALAAADADDDRRYVDLKTLRTARTVLSTKANRVETAREMGRRNRGPYSHETCRKVSDACRFIKSLSAEGRLYYLAERKARWLTNVIRTDGDRKVFDLAGVFEGRAYDIHIEMPSSATLLDFLLLIMRHEGAPAIMRLDAAKTAAKLMHAPPKPVVTVERATPRRRRHG